MKYHFFIGIEDRKPRKQIRDERKQNKNSHVNRYQFRDFDLSDKKIELIYTDNLFPKKDTFKLSLENRDFFIYTKALPIYKQQRLAIGWYIQYPEETVDIARGLINERRVRYDVAVRNVTGIEVADITGVDFAKADIDYPSAFASWKATKLRDVLKDIEMKAEIIIKYPLSKNAKNNIYKKKHSNFTKEQIEADRLNKSEDNFDRQINTKDDKYKRKQKGDYNPLVTMVKLEGETWLEFLYRLGYEYHFKLIANKAGSFFRVVPISSIQQVYSNQELLKRTYIYGGFNSEVVKILELNIKTNPPPPCVKSLFTYSGSPHTAITTVDSKGNISHTIDTTKRSDAELNENKDKIIDNNIEMVYNKTTGKYDANKSGIANTTIIAVKKNDKITKDGKKEPRQSSYPVTNNTTVVSGKENLYQINNSDIVVAGETGDSNEQGEMSVQSYPEAKTIAIAESHNTAEGLNVTITKNETGKLNFYGKKGDVTGDEYTASLGGASMFNGQDSAMHIANVIKSAVQSGDYGTKMLGKDVNKQALNSVLSKGKKSPLADKYCRGMKRVTFVNKQENRKVNLDYIDGYYGNKYLVKLLVVGCPDVLAGDYVKLGGITDLFDKIYLVKKAIHKISNENGYTTELTLTNNEEMKRIKKYVNVGQEAISMQEDKSGKR